MRLGKSQTIVTSFEFHLLVTRGRQDIRLRVAVFDGSAFFRNIVEEREQRIEVGLRDRIIFVIVTSGTHRGQPEPDRGRRFHSINDVFDGIFFGDDSPFCIAAVIAVESRRDFLFQRRFGQLITGKLFDGELVERHVGIERFDDPVAPAPHRAFAIALIATGVRVPRRVQPADGHSLAVSCRRKQPIDDPFIGIR